MYIILVALYCHYFLKSGKTFWMCSVGHFGIAILNVVLPLMQVKDILMQTTKYPSVTWLLHKIMNNIFWCNKQLDITLSDHNLWLELNLLYDHNFRGKCLLITNLENMASFQSLVNDITDNQPVATINLSRFHVQSSNWKDYSLVWLFRYLKNLLNHPKMQISECWCCRGNIQDGKSPLSFQIIIFNSKFLFYEFANTFFLFVITTATNNRLLMHTGSNNF